MQQSEFIKNYGIAITGGIACGKSTVCNMIRELGFSVIDADLLARDLLNKGEKVYNDFVLEFGPSILLENGDLDKRQLRKMLADPILKKKIEGLTHPEIALALRAKLENLDLYRQKNFWFYEAAVIVEAGKHKEFKELWVVACPPEVQIKRLMARDQMSEEEAKKLISTQMPLNEKEQLADHVIRAVGPLESIQQDLLKLLNHLQTQ